MLLAIAQGVVKGNLNHLLISNYSLAVLENQVL